MIGDRESCKRRGCMVSSGADDEAGATLVREGRSCPRGACQLGRRGCFGGGLCVLGGESESSLGDRIVDIFTPDDRFGHYPVER
jgi:hypothetical protein